MSTLPSSFFGVVRNPARDAMALQAKVVLSVFAFDLDVTHNVDMFRILPLLSIGAFVIAESNGHPFYDVMKSEGLVTGSYGELPLLCKQWVAKPAKERLDLSSKLKHFVCSRYNTQVLLASTLGRRFQRLRRTQREKTKAKTEIKPRNRIFKLLRLRS